MAQHGHDLRARREVPRRRCLDPHPYPAEHHALGPGSGIRPGSPGSPPPQSRQRAACPLLGGGSGDLSGVAVRVTSRTRPSLALIRFQVRPVRRSATRIRAGPAATAARGRGCGVRGDGRPTAVPAPLSDRSNRCSALILARSTASHPFFGSSTTASRRGIRSADIRRAGGRPPPSREPWRRCRARHRAHAGTGSTRLQPRSARRLFDRQLKRLLEFML